MRELEQRFPKGLKYEIAYDTTPFVRESVNEVFNTLRDYDDAALVPALKAWGASKRKLDNRDKEELESTLQFLERDRALTKGV